MTTPPELVEEFIRAKQRFDIAQWDLNETQARLIKSMEAEQRKTYSWTDDQGRSNRLTYVASHTTEIDEPGLRKALTARVFDKYTKRVLDRRAMERAMDAGEVDPTTVSRYVTLKPRKPFLKYTQVDKTQEDS